MCLFGGDTNQIVRLSFFQEEMGAFEDAEWDET